MRRLALLLFVAACKTSGPTSTDPATSAWVAPSSHPAPSDERLALLDRWNDAMRAHDVGALDALYDERVLFYGLSLPRSAVVERVAGVFRATPDFIQTVGNATVEVGDASDLVRIAFTKDTTAHGTRSSFAAYVVLRRVGTSYRIVEESDATTDAALRSPRDG